MNWMSILGLCLIVLGTIFSFFGTYFSDKHGQEELTTKIQEKNKTIDEINTNNVKLIDQNTSLLNSNDQVSQTNKDLINQNNDMLSKIDKYQSDIEERNKRIALLEGEVNNVKEYSYYATLNIYGLDKEYGSGLTFHSDLSDRMRKIVITENGKQTMKIGQSTMHEINEVIDRYPNFPFGYFVKSKLERLMGIPDWKTTAKKALGIFEITTSIKGHSTSHDVALSELKTDLAKNK